MALRMPVASLLTRILVLSGENEAPRKLVESRKSSMGYLSGADQAVVVVRVASRRAVADCMV